MKKGLFTIVFMIICTIVFISALAFINEISRERIEQNLKMENFKSMLYAFDIFPNGVHEKDFSSTSTTSDIQWDNQQLLDNIEDQIKSKKLPVKDADQALLKNSFLSINDSVEIYIRYDQNGNRLAFGFPMKGKGLWGTISAFGAVSADLTKMVGIDFTEQVETPGLGARILETEFKYFFRNLDLSGFGSDKKNPIIMLKSKDKSNVEQSTNSFQAITGATQTVNGVLTMVNTDLKFYIKIIQENLADL